jgi:Flp pilus assembly secretin CpaC
LTIDLAPGQSKIVRTRIPLSRVLVTLPSVVQVAVYDPTQFELVGGTPGQTTLTLWFGDGKQQVVLRYLVHVSRPPK